MHENEKVNNVMVNQCQRAPHQGHHRVSNIVTGIPQMSIQQQNFNQLSLETCLMETSHYNLEIRREK